MGNQCANGNVEDDTAERDDILHSDRPSMRNNRRKSLLRVGSRLFGASFRNHHEKSRKPTRRASTYNHVHDAVMYNFSEAGLDKRGGVPVGVIGLRNLGNTCFINSSLQCLSNTIPLTDYFLGYDYRGEINRDNFLGTGGKLVVAYAELMKTMWMNDDSRVVEPSSFKRQLSTFAPQFAGYRQHDAQELLAYLLDGIHEDLNRVKKKPYIEEKDCDGTNDEEDAVESWKNYLRRDRSLIVDIFQGQLRNICECRKCEHRNIRFEPFMYLSLPISDKCTTLEDCLQLYLDVEDLTGDNKWYCEKCKKHVDATKKIDLWILPPILIIHLKRFRYDEFGRAGRKNEAPLRYPITDWDLGPRIRSRRGDKPVYDLYAVANHLGGLGGGHYTACALNRFDDQWYEFNDSRYATIDPESRFGSSSSPYLLFYNRSQGDLDGTSPSFSRIPLIRRQSVSRPELWPHSQVREGQFRDFRRSTRNMTDGANGLELSHTSVRIPGVPKHGEDRIDESNTESKTPAKQPSKRPSEKLTNGTMKEDLSGEIEGVEVSEDNTTEESGNIRKSSRNVTEKTRSNRENKGKKKRSSKSSKSKKKERSTRSTSNHKKSPNGGAVEDPTPSPVKS